MKKEKSKKENNYQLPSVDGFDVIESLNNIQLEKTQNEENVPSVDLNEIKTEKIKFREPTIEELFAKSYTRQKEQMEIAKKEKAKNHLNFILEIGIPADNIEKQLKKQKMVFDSSSIQKYDKMIRGIVELKNEEIIGKVKCRKLIFKVYERAIKHVYFINEML